MSERICQVYSAEQFDLVAGRAIGTLLADYDCLEIDGKPDLHHNGKRPLEGADVLWVRPDPHDRGRATVAAQLQIDLPEAVAETGGISIHEAELIVGRHMREVSAYLLTSYGAELTCMRGGCIRFWESVSSELTVTCLIRDVAGRSVLATLWEQGGAGRHGISRAVGARVLDFIEHHYADERVLLAEARHHHTYGTWGRPGTRVRPWPAPSPTPSPTPPRRLVDR